ncbi:ribose 5-phosphate isomerase B [Mechercharimyces sp. CAU 1602]|uniref:ribose 5-phosphate isomerase B n=1 Tax=Mechercharimyces sp. CAU 1602 TaxID=2973933 RepID=UPI002163720F|nr:ribose 5-phosphate isomerase B [Mechercharimyces sp. CAU 1602]MCS1352307.1 ribose 5-phosphate isomerase B [Mechercharimyces sp. CAU 1602]
MRLAIGSDHGGLKLKQSLVSLLEEMEIDVVDVGCYDDAHSVDYPDYAGIVAKKVVAAEVELGILVCGTGIGMSIAANKVNGVRCAVVSDTFSARMAREHNNANILAIGERVVGAGLAHEIVSAWLESSYAGGRHQRRVEKIHSLEG